MNTSGALQATPKAQMRDWEAELKRLKTKLRAARPLTKIQYYELIKTIQGKISSMRK